MECISSWNSGVPSFSNARIITFLRHFKNSILNVLHGEKKIKIVSNFLSYHLFNNEVFVTYKYTCIMHAKRCIIAEPHTKLWFRVFLSNFILYRFRKINIMKQLTRKLHFLACQLSLVHLLTIKGYCSDYNINGCYNLKGMNYKLSS